jgi:hypothetical protein
VLLRRLQRWPGIGIEIHVCAAFGCSRLFCLLPNFIVFIVFLVPFADEFYTVVLILISSQQLRYWFEVLMRHLSAFRRFFVDNTSSMLFIQACRITLDAILSCCAGCPSVDFALRRSVASLGIQSRGCRSGCIFDVADCRRLARFQQFDESG